MKKKSRVRMLCLSLFGGLLFMGLGLIPSTAMAQYKHSAIGVYLSFPYTFNVGGNPSSNNLREQNGYGVGAGGSVGLEYSNRFLDKWAFAIEAHLSVHSCGVPNDICVSGSTPMMFAAFTDLRYYFLSDEFRPFVDFGIGYWQTLTFVTGNISAPGPTVAVGFDWFLKEDISIGVKARYGLQLFIDPQKGFFPFHQFMGLLNISFYV